MPNLNTRSKKKLLSASAIALRICGSMAELDLSFERIHELHKRATPKQMMNYRLALQLYKIQNTTLRNDDWVDLNFQQNFNERNDMFHIIDNSSLRVV